MWPRRAGKVHPYNICDMCCGDGESACRAEDLLVRFTRGYSNARERNADANLERHSGHALVYKSFRRSLYGYLRARLTIREDIYQLHRSEPSSSTTFELAHSCPKILNSPGFGSLR